jgi:glycosyltransferase involved in cell wall biosynthesis
MTERRLNFGPRFARNGADWVCDDGRPADPEDVGIEATIDGDGCMRIAIGDQHDRHEWELTPGQAAELGAFFVLQPAR